MEQFAFSIIILEQTKTENCLLYGNQGLCVTWLHCLKSHLPDFFDGLLLQIIVLICFEHFNIILLWC